MLDCLSFGGRDSRREQAYQKLWGGQALPSRAEKVWLTRGG